jgi:uncharacterized protein YjbI with pentapeptide repeats
VAICTQCTREAAVDDVCLPHYVQTCPTDDQGRKVVSELDLSHQRTSDVDLSKVVITGRLRCVETTFTGPVRIREAQIHEADFSGAKFEAYVSIKDVRVEQQFRLPGATFDRDVEVADLTCGAQLRMARATFVGSVDLSGVHAPAMDLRRVTFHHRVALHLGQVGSVDMRRATFDRGVRVTCEKATRIDMIEADLGGPSVLTAVAETIDKWRMQDRPVLGRVLGTDLSMLRLSYVDLSRCSFTGAHNLDKLTVDDWHGWGTTPRSFWVTHRVTLADEHRVRHGKKWKLPGDTAEAPSADSVQGDYHALRSMMQDRKDQRSASDFYYGEMEMRRMGLWRSLRGRIRLRRWRPAASSLGEWALVFLYWLLSGYGQRAWRAFTTLGVVVVAASSVLARWGFKVPTDFGDALRFTLRSATSVLRETSADLTATGDWIELGVRLVAPLLLALGLFAIRDRVRR